MAARKVNWSWPLRIRRRGTTSGSEAEYSPHHQPEDSAWNDLASDGQGGAHVSPSTSQVQSPHWLSELESPYGMSDGDGTLQELDSVNWRRVSRFSRKHPRRFIPKTSHRARVQQGNTGTTRWQSDSQPDAPQLRAGRPQPGAATLRSRAGSTWMLQFGAAVVVTLVAIYAHNGTTPLANTLRGVYHKAFATDYTQAASPAISRFLKAHNIAVPAFLSQSGAMKLHVPLQGTITQDYSSSHPQMAILGKPSEPVLAAGSGTVSRVVPLQSGVMVVIDHGSIGSSYYFGLKVASVKMGESVVSGQVIGTLPATPNPKLMFELEQDGKAVNPHDYIVFPGSTANS